MKSNSVELTSFVDNILVDIFQIVLCVYLILNNFFYDRISNGNELFEHYSYCATGMCYFENDVKFYDLFIKYILLVNLYIKLIKSIKICSVVGIRCYFKDLLYSLTGLAIFKMCTVEYKITIANINMKFLVKKEKYVKIEEYCELTKEIFFVDNDKILIMGNEQLLHRMNYHELYDLNIDDYHIISVDKFLEYIEKDSYYNKIKKLIYSPYFLFSFALYVILFIVLPMFCYHYFNSNMFLYFFNLNIFEQSVTEAIKIRDDFTASVGTPQEKIWLNLYNEVLNTNKSAYNISKEIVLQKGIVIYIIFHILMNTILLIMFYNIFYKFHKKMYIGYLIFSISEINNGFDIFKDKYNSEKSKKEGSEMKIFKDL